jgi:hypothetical protein
MREGGKKEEKGKESKGGRGTEVWEERRGKGRGTTLTLVHFLTHQSSKLI